MVAMLTRAFALLVDEFLGARPPIRQHTLTQFAACWVFTAVAQTVMPTCVSQIAKPREISLHMDDL